MKEMVTKFVKEERVEEVVIGNGVIMLLLYADDVVFLAANICLQFPEYMRRLYVVCV